MKHRNHIIRLIVLLIIGLYLIYKIYQFKFSIFVFEVIFIIGISIIWLIYWFWIIYKDVKLFKLTKAKKFLVGPVLGIIFIGTVLGINWINNSDFAKPTLVRAYNNGDFNGASIDFKKDGTYIFDNHALGFSKYIYGKYEINGQSINLDRNEIDNVIKTDLLEIKDIPKDGIEYLAGTYIFQVEPNGNKIKRTVKFRVVEDNRK